MSMRAADRPGSLVPPSVESATLRILLIEDDLGDALLVRHFLDEGDLDARLTVARSLGEARDVLTDAEFRCVLVDLSLPDADGLDLLREVLYLAPRAAVLVLTGRSDARTGVAAVAAGAEDYLVKQEVDASLLGRAIRYSIERKHADESEKELVEARLLSQENARLALGLLPVPQLQDTTLSHYTRYRPGRQRALLGGDFHDTIQTADGSVHLMIGDVSGHGPDEASLGVRLRMAWRALVLAGQRGGTLLATLDEILTLERWSEEIFTTLCMVTIHPDRRHATIFRAGHPCPLVFSGGTVTAVLDEDCGPAIGLFTDSEWPEARIELRAPWALMLYTDGLIEGRVGDGARRLDTEGLVALTLQAHDRGMSGHKLLDTLVTDAEHLNGGVLTDDVAILLLTGGQR
jgi:serine phosphatase RsbU (regulator of sigma subunit)